MFRLMSRIQFLIFCVASVGFGGLLSGQSLPRSASYALADQQGVGMPNYTATLDGGAVVVMGAADSSFLPAGSTMRMVVIKMDSMGAVQWSTQIDSIVPVPEYSRIVQQADSSYFFCIATNYDSVYYTAIRMKKDGTISWTKDIYFHCAPTQLFAPAVMSMNDGTCVVSGGLSDSVYNPFTQVTRIDSTGGVLWSNVYRNDLFPWPMLDTFSNGDLLLVTGGWVNFHSTTRVQRINSSGAVAWTKEIWDTVESNVKCVRMLPDDRFIILGRADLTSISNEDITLTMCDDSANVLWSKRWGNLNFTLRPEQILIDPDGFSVIGNNDLYEGFHSKFDSLGNHTWSRKYPGTSMMSIGHHLDSGYTVWCGTMAGLTLMRTDWNGNGCGSLLMPLTQHPFNPTAYTDSTGITVLGTDVYNGTWYEGTCPVLVNGVCSTVSVEETDQSRLLVFPVPAAEQLTIVSDESISLLELFNMQGGLALHVEHNTQEIQLDVSSLPPGIYMLCVSGNSGTAFRKVIIGH